MSNYALIYDLETLSQDHESGAIASLAALLVNEDRYSTMPYTYDELISTTKYIKFDVEDQVKNYDRTVSLDTIKWWSQQGPVAKRQITKSPDRDVSIERLYDFMTDTIDGKKLTRVYTRGCFDSLFLHSILRTCGKESVYDWWKWRDTKSLIEGMLWGTKYSNDFIPDDITEIFVKHDPIHDVAMDIYRIQTVSNILTK